MELEKFQFQFSCYGSYYFVSMQSMKELLKEKKERKESQ